MTTIISALNQKGGAGKTTMAINLAACLIEQGRRVVVADADPQQSAARWARQGDGMGFLVQPLQLDKSAQRFKAELDRLAADADLAIIDCPPELTDPARVAALLSDLVLVPCTPSPLDIWAAEAAVELAQDARALKNTHTPLVAMVPSKIQGQTVISRDIRAALAAMGEPIAPSISQRVALAECVVVGQAITDYAPHGPSHQEFANLATFVLQNLRKVEHGQRESPAVAAG